MVMWTREMALQEKVIATTPDDHSSIPRTYMGIKGNTHTHELKDEQIHIHIHSQYMVSLIV